MSRWVSLTLNPARASRLRISLGDHHRTVMSARAAKRDGQVAFALADVVRNQVDQQLRNSIDEFDGLREGPDIARDAGIAAGQVFELGNVIGIRQEADVEDQVAVGRHAMPVAEAGDVDADVGLLGAAAELVFDDIPQLVDIELRGIDDVVGHGADGRQPLALGANVLYAPRNRGQAGEDAGFR